MIQLWSLIGALLILSAFAAQQLGYLRSDARGYLGFNLIGSLILAVVAWVDRQWGFLLLEGVWALVSAWSLVRCACR